MNGVLAPHAHGRRDAVRRVHEGAARTAPLYPLRYQNAIHAQPYLPISVYSKFPFTASGPPAAADRR